MIKSIILNQIKIMISSIILLETLRIPKARKFIYDCQPIMLLGNSFRLIPVIITRTCRRFIDHRHKSIAQPKEVMWIMSTSIASAKPAISSRQAEKMEEWYTKKIQQSTFQLLIRAGKTHSPST
jgi:hypothetical protein